MNVSLSNCLQYRRLFRLSLIFLTTFGLMAKSVRSIAQDFVLLSNGNVIQGKATSMGDHVIIDRGGGNELKLAARQVLHSASTLTDLYRYRQRQGQQPHVESYQNDARWCYRHQLYDEMKQALDAADELDPSHPETLRLRRQLALIVAGNSTSEPIKRETGDSQFAPAAGQVVISVASQSVKNPLTEEATEEELAKANLSLEAVAYFSNRVQPLLLNRCGNSGCHRSSSGSKWQLTHMGSHVRPPARMTKLNLLATISLVNRANYMESDLVKYATNPHGGKAEAPLKRGDDAAVESLIEWIKEVSRQMIGEDATSLTELPGDSGNTTPTFSAKSRPDSSQPMPNQVRQATYLEGEEPFASNTIAVNPLSFDSDSKVDRNRPTRLPTVENPFDPAIFNRYYRDGAVADNRDR